MTENPFETHADDYDQWFETELGKQLFELELEALKQIVPPEPSNWLEIGVGTGRFAQALGVKMGIDPSQKMAELASSRGMDVRITTAENLQFEQNSLDGVLMIHTLCFVNDPVQALKECRRVLKPGGTLVIAIIPKDSRWGIFHTRRGAQGDTFYSTAKFLSTAEASDLIHSSGFQKITTVSIELPSPIDSLECKEKSFSILTAQA